jgi:hypothetical protein
MFAYGVTFLDSNERRSVTVCELLMRITLMIGERVMHRNRLVTIVAVFGLTAVMVVSLRPARVGAQSGHEHHDHAGKMDMKSHVNKPLTLEQIHSKHLPMTSKSIDRAIAAIGAKDVKTALAELHKVQKMLAVINETVGKHVKPKFANVRCPIMDGPIVAEKVTKKLTREYKGRKIAFCCAGCPSAWDKLSDAKKDAKLAKVRPTLQEVWTCSMHPQVKLPKSGLCPICNMGLIPLSENHSGHKH